MNILVPCWSVWGGDASRVRQILRKKQEKKNMVSCRLVCLFYGYDEPANLFRTASVERLPGSFPSIEQLRAEY